MPFSDPVEGVDGNNYSYQLACPETQARRVSFCSPCTRVVHMGRSHTHSTRRHAPGFSIGSPADSCPCRLVQTAQLRAVTVSNTENTESSNLATFRRFLFQWVRGLEPNLQPPTRSGDEASSSSTTRLTTPSPWLLTCWSARPGVTTAARAPQCLATDRSPSARMVATGSRAPTACACSGRCTTPCAIPWPGC